MPRCQATTADGRPCGAPEQLVDPSTGLCISHDPDRAGVLREAGLKGGIAMRKKARDDKGLTHAELPPLDGPASAALWTEVIGRAVATGRIPASRGQTALRAVSEFLRAHAAGETADRLARLQSQVDGLRNGKDSS